MSDKTIDELLHPKMGIFDPTLKFAFTNITEEPFEIMWDGAVVTQLKAGASVELPHYLAVKCVKELVDRIMIGNAKMNELEFYQKNVNAMPNTYRAASSLAVPAARKVWEDQIVHLMAADEESPQVQIMRAQIKEELMKDLNAEASTGSPLENAPASLSDFADLTADKETPVKQSKIKVKEITS
jgi:hypothetical protein